MPKLANLIHSFDRLTLSEITVEKTGKNTLKYHVYNDDFSTITTFKMDGQNDQFNLNLKNALPIKSTIKELGNFSSHYNFRDDTTELKFDRTLNKRNVSIFIDGKVISISNGGVVTSTPKGEEKAYSNRPLKGGNLHSNV